MRRRKIHQIMEYFIIRIGFHFLQLSISKYSNEVKIPLLKDNHSNPTPISFIYSLVQIQIMKKNNLYHIWSFLISSCFLPITLQFFTEEKLLSPISNTDKEGIEDTTNEVIDKKDCLPIWIDSKRGRFTRLRYLHFFKPSSPILNDFNNERPI